MSAFTPVVPREEHAKPMEEVEVVEEIEEIEEVEVVVYPGEVELEDEDGVTLTELEGIVIRSAEVRPDSWPQNKRRAPASPTFTELGEDSEEEQEEVVYPKVVLKFKGKIEGAHTRSKEQSKAGKGKGKRRVNEESDDPTGPTIAGNSTPNRRNGAELGGPLDQQYWVAHKRFAQCPAGIWLHEAVKPGFMHSSVAMRNTCQAAFHVITATPADCMFHMEQTDIDYMKYLRTAVVGYKKRLEKGLGFASHNRVNGLQTERGEESDGEENDGEDGVEAEQETQVIGGVEVGQAGPSSLQAMAQMQKDLHNQFEELKKQQVLLSQQQQQMQQQQQQQQSERHHDLQTYSHQSSFDGVLMVASLPETQEEAHSAARVVSDYLSTLPAAKQTRAHVTAIKLARDYPQKQSSIEAWVSAMQIGPLGRHKPYTVKIALTLVLNPMKSCTWAYSQVGARISHASTVLSMAYNLRTHAFTRSDMERARVELPDMEEGQPSLPRSKVSAQWTSAEETRRRASASLAEAFGEAPPASAPATAPIMAYPRFNAASLQVMQAAAQVSRAHATTPVDLTCDEDAAIAASAEAPAIADNETAITPAEFALLKKRHPSLDGAFRTIALRTDLDDAQKKKAVMDLVRAEESKASEASSSAQTTSSDDAVITKEVYRDALGNRVIEEMPAPAPAAAPAPAPAPTAAPTAWTVDTLGKVAPASSTPLALGEFRPVTSSSAPTYVVPLMVDIGLNPDFTFPDAIDTRTPDYLNAKDYASEATKKAWNIVPGECPRTWRRRRMLLAAEAVTDPAGGEEQARQQRRLFAMANRREPFDPTEKLKPSLSLLLDDGSWRPDPNNDQGWTSGTLLLPIPYARAGDLVTVVLNDGFKIPSEDIISPCSKFNAVVPESFGRESRPRGRPIKMQFPVKCWHKRRDPGSGERMWVYTNYGINASIVAMSIRTACWEPDAEGAAPSVDGGKASCKYLLQRDVVVVHPVSATATWPHDVYERLSLPLKECTDYPKAWFQEMIAKRKAEHLAAAPAPAPSPSPQPRHTTAWMNGAGAIVDAQKQLEENGATAAIVVDTTLSPKSVQVWYYLNCSLLFGAVQEDKTLTFYQRRRLSECSHRHYERETTKTPDEIWKSACTTVSSIAGRLRLLKASEVLKQRGHDGCLGRARFHHASLKQFKAEKGRAVAAGMAPHDFPLQAAWCEPLWNLMTEDQKQVFINKKRASTETEASALASLFG